MPKKYAPKRDLMQIGRAVVDEEAIGEHILKALGEKAGQ
jgi:hypothetical protein